MPNNQRGAEAASQTHRIGEICFQCRNRKVRCDGEIGGCRNCRSLSFVCSLSRAGPDEEHDHRWISQTVGTPESRVDLDLFRLQRKRTSRACFQCRTKKAKCSGHLPSCQRCSDRSLECHYSSTQRRMRPSESSVAKSPDTPTTTSIPLQNIAGLLGHMEPRPPELSRKSLPRELSIDRSFTDKHIAAFFEFVYPIPCFGFIHKTLFVHSWSQNTHSPRLLRAICGVSARFLSPRDEQHQRVAATWIEEAQNMIYAQASDLTVADVEALILISLDHAISRRFAQAMVTTALAARVAYMMRLNHENKQLPSIVQERRRRLMWSIFVFDKFFSSGRPEFTVCPKDTIHLQLPWSERSFALDITAVTEPLRSFEDSQQQSNLGLMALCIRLLDIRHRIARLLQKLVQRRKPLSECLPKLKALQGELSALHHRLPPDLTFDSKNLLLRAYTPGRTTFIMFHIWWHQCHCDLYRFTIPGFREALPVEELGNLSLGFASYCREKCLEHAMGVSTVLAMMLELEKDVFIPDPSLAICAFHSARIIFHLGQPEFGNLARSDLVDALTACSKILNKQSEIYPTTNLLQQGIQDLIHDAQQSPGARSPRRSTWEMEQTDPEADHQQLSLSAAQPSSKFLEVYSRYSVADEIRQLRFREEESELIHSLDSDTASVTKGATHRHVGRDGSSRPLEDQVMAGQSPSSPFISRDTPYLVSTQRPFEWQGAEDDLSLILGMDLGEDFAQPDAFLDAFFGQGT